MESMALYVSDTISCRYHDVASKDFARSNGQFKRLIGSNSSGRGFAFFQEALFTHL